jgi:hypothetical protein
MMDDNITNNIDTDDNISLPKKQIIFRKFEDVYNYITENELVIYNYIMFYNEHDRCIVITKHALERLNKRFGEYFSDSMWEFLLTSQNNIIKLLKGDKCKSYTKRLKNEKNKYTTSLYGIRSIWAKKKIILRRVNKISLHSNKVELIENYISEGDDIILISMYYFDACKSMKRYCKKM